MQNTGIFTHKTKTRKGSNTLSRQAMIGIILVVALLAFEVFNFDTTRFALENLLNGASFLSIGWATILAIAFCAIDFAGLAHLFTPERGLDEPKEVWFLTGAWLLGATMNALMTWWAVSLILISHPLIGNEVLTRNQIVSLVPIFVAVLVWLTRILFIGAFSVAGAQVFRPALAQVKRAQPRATARPKARYQPVPKPMAAAPRYQPRRVAQPVPMSAAPATPATSHRPARSYGGGGYKPRPVSLHAAPRK